MARKKHAPAPVVEDDDSVTTTTDDVEPDDEEETEAPPLSDRLGNPPGVNFNGVNKLNQGCGQGARRAR